MILADGDFFRHVKSSKWLSGKQTSEAIRGNHVAVIKGTRKVLDLHWDQREVTSEKTERSRVGSHTIYQTG